MPRRRKWTLENAPHLIPTAEWRKRARSARKRLGISQSELARRIGGSQPTVSQIESGSDVGAKMSPYVVVMSQELDISWPIYDDDEDLSNGLAYLEKLKFHDPAKFYAHLEYLRSAAKILNNDDDG